MQVTIPKPVRLGAIALTVIIVMGYALAGITTINPGEVGLLVKMLGSDRGMQEQTLDTGTRWVEPVKYDVPVYDTRIKKYSIENMESQTGDGQPILVDISMEVSLIDKYVPVLHETVGDDYYEQLVYPAFRAISRISLATERSNVIFTGEARLRIEDRMNEAFKERLLHRGIRVLVNFRDLNFVNQEFINVLEQKAVAAQKEEIERRLAAAAEQGAIKVANVAEGAKQKVIKEAEGESERLRLMGLGERQMKEEQAKGNLAIGTAAAEVIRLRNAALDGPGGDKLVAIKWAENLGPNVKVYGFPTGSPGTTSLMDLNGIMQGALKGMPVK